MTMRGLAVFALLLAVSHAAEIHISASCGDAHDIDRGVIRGAGNNWRFEPTTVSPSLVNCLAAAASSSQLVTVHALMRSGSSERLSTASIPLCALKAANFEEEFTVHLDEDGKPFHVSYLASSSGCDTSAVSADSVHFSTKVAARRTSEGPVATEVARRARSADGEPEKKADTPFYMSPTFLLGVVFVVFVMPMLTGAPPEGGAQGAGGAAAAAPARR